MTPEFLLVASLLSPVAGGILILAAGRSPGARDILMVAAAVVTAVFTLMLAAQVLDGARPVLTLHQLMPGLPIGFAVEPLGMIFAAVAGTLWPITAVYSIGYMRGNHEVHQTRFHFCFALAIVSALALAYSDGLLSMFIAYEVLTLSTYPLVTHSGTKEAMKAGRTYLGILLGTSIGFQLTAIIGVYVLAGTVAFTAGGVLPDGLSPALLGLLLGLFAYGIGKVALMPLHAWLPAAMVAPTPVSALLHAVAVVKGGAFAVVKVVAYTLGADRLSAAGANDWLVWVAAASIVIASSIALTQDHLKRRLAYSTVSQLAYVTLAAAIMAPLSLVGAAMHIAAHAVGKITLFFAAGSIHTAAHKDYVSQLDGIGRRMPWTMGAFALATLSMIGLPPAVGFTSKWFILEGAVSREQWIAVAALGASTLLNAAYFLPIVWRAFFRAPVAAKSVGAAAPHGGDGHHDHGEAPLPMVLAILTTAGLTFLLFLYPDPVLALAEAMAGTVTQGGLR